MRRFCAFWGRAPSHLSHSREFAQIRGFSVIPSRPTAKRGGRAEGSGECQLPYMRLQGILTKEVARPLLSSRFARIRADSRLKLSSSCHPEPSDREAGRASRGIPRMPVSVNAVAGNSDQKRWRVLCSSPLASIRVKHVPACRKFAAQKGLANSRLCYN